MAELKNGNGRVWKGVQTALLIGSLAFLAIDKLVIPSVNSGKLADKIQAQAEQIARIEECIITLRPLPREVSALTGSVESVKSTVDRVEKQLNRHMDATIRTP